MSREVKITKHYTTNEKRGNNGKNKKKTTPKKYSIV
jgi:hypothetical protein